MNLLNGILGIVPVILSLVQTVEGLFTKGSDKKAAVVSGASSVLAILQSTGVITAQQQAKFPAAVSAYVDATVTFLNAVGVLPASTDATSTSTGK